jgi:coenzyme F420-reducing hydrogenase delta subunit
VTEVGISAQTQSPRAEPAPSLLPTGAAASVTMFVCTNGARPGISPSSGVRLPPPHLAQRWPFSVREVMVPCAGKLQPEHFLKAFEAGADLVCVVACDADNCHTLEGSRRAQHRVEFVKGLLDETGVGRERLLMTSLPGSATEDMSAACGGGGGAEASAAREREIAARLADLSKQIAHKIETLGRSPLHRSSPSP